MRKATALGWLLSINFDTPTTAWTQIPEIRYLSNWVSAIHPKTEIPGFKGRTLRFE